MEVDTDAPVSATLPPPQTEDESAITENDSNVRDNAIHIRGVDDLNTNDIEKLLLAYYNKPFQIEWIDDSSLNIVYDDPEDAFQSLVALTSPEEFEAPEPISPDQLRRAKQHPSHPDSGLEIRFALKSDKKASGSRARSRYYLLHGEPTHKDDLVRFGSRRSAPMKYGFKDILSKSRREDRVGDLFPEKTKQVNLDEVDMDMDDLLPQKKPKRGRRGRGGRGRRGRGNNAEPDLFADKLKSGPKKATDDRTEKSEASAKPSVFQNMDY